jgi:hypothetical protein
MRRLADVHERLTPADHQTHRAYTFSVPEDCTELRVHVCYSPKFTSSEESSRLVDRAVSNQRTRLLAGGVEEVLAEAWALSSAARRASTHVANLITPSLDDAQGVYRGAAHRQPADAQLVIGVHAASPGLVAGPLPAGAWRLTLSVHTLVSPEVEVSIQVGAETASSLPSAARSST